MLEMKCHWCSQPAQYTVVDTDYINKLACEMHREMVLAEGGRDA